MSNKRKPPSCSVIITTYNSHECISAAIDSILKQHSVNVEIVVVDDCSQDIHKLESVLKSYSNYPIRLIQNLQKGNANVSRNIGIGHAKYDYVAFLDADDVHEPKHLIESISALNHKNASLCFSKVQFSKGEIIQPYPQPAFDGDIAKFIFNNGVAVTSSIVAKRSALLQCMFDETLEKHQDWDFLLRFERQFPVCQSDYIGLTYTLSTGVNMSSKANPAATILFLNNTLPKQYHKSMIHSQLSMIIDKKDSLSLNTLKNEILNNYNFDKKILGRSAFLYIALFSRGFHKVLFPIYRTFVLIRKSYNKLL
ncbi:glycosyltransferase [Thalassotalea ponticola]|uniref:glycosyltransferase family 2 protein n=1 Tax=Thalassotalea ponticola TaxID=1523392 RepID=UPI0025B3C1A1|nr:glycosyltransferase [Thalassotalea ponticola]MDN3652651.1 glycosyltransferase [Thalassotalea ponticola]